MLTIERPALEQLAALLLDRAGLKVAPDGFHGLKLALSARMPALGISDAEEYVRRLQELAGEHELRSLLPLVTVGHTEFFRDPRQFKALEQKLIPELLAQVRRENRQGLIWSAGCATGEEPYSLAMLLEELGASPKEVRILATDLNPAAIENAKSGRFPHRRVVAIPEARRARFFTRSKDFYEVAPSLKNYIQFDGLNLASPVFAHVLPGSMDMILCRNVIIYFDLKTIRSLMDRFLSALKPTGYLLLGYSESLFRVFDRFEMVEVAGSFVYRPGTAPALVSRPTPLPFPKVTLPRADGASSPPKARQTGEFLALGAAPSPSLTPPARKSGEFPALVPPKAPPPAARSPVQRLNEIVKQMQVGDFKGALEASLKLVDEEGDLNALLTLGNLYSVQGKTDLAREIFDRVLFREPLCVEARVFGGVAALQAGLLSEARAELAKALFLEPTLSLGHYLLAQVEERTGHREAARRCYRNAVAQLRFPQRPLAGYYPDLPDSPEFIGRAAKYALAALEEG